ncbi:LysR family transcriptional regulator [Tistrella bauzanensis]|uniref:LysR family transcriptional regulator n=1 Tax=Tistrella bauzanensis TaxID=657419 RepID=A0ABQ1IKI5_9PROT|nr:LysR family transcriptional regulator [Tistrella bauzanensis]GGB45154.1 LysR family transcriptional regulator [Tistrella bauzanensis]
MNWEDLRHFGALAAEGTLSAAARRLGVEHATVARRVAALERALGVALVDRRGRRFTLTADGERIALVAARMDDDARAVARVAAGARATLTGTVTLSAPPALAVRCLTAPLVALQRQHPGLAIRIIGEARSASLDRREADLVVRISRPDDGDLVIVKLGEMAFRFYASPDYLAAVAEPDWCFVGYEMTAGLAAQQAVLVDFAAGRPFSIHAGNLDIQHEAARAGGGIACLPDFMVTPSSGLVPVAATIQPLRRDIWLAMHADMKEAAPVRAVSRHLRALFSAPGAPFASGPV